MRKSRRDALPARFNGGTLEIELEKAPLLFALCVFLGSLCDRFVSVVNLKSTFVAKYFPLFLHLRFSLCAVVFSFALESPSSKRSSPCNPYLILFSPLARSNCTSQIWSSATGAFKALWGSARLICHCRLNVKLQQTPSQASTWISPALSE